MTWVEIGRNDMGILNDTFKGYKKGASKFLFFEFLLRSKFKWFYHINWAQGILM